MIEPPGTDLLVKRITLAAQQAGAGAGRVTAESIARGVLPPVPEPLPVLPSPLRAAAEIKIPGAPEFPLDEVASMLPRARSKIAVGDHVPGLFRPLARNQGGFNFILLDILARLLEVNRQLQRQTHELQGRVIAMQAWMNTAARSSSAQHEWMLAVENRLRSLSPEQLTRWEERLARVEAVVEKNDPEALV